MVTGERKWCQCSGKENVESFNWNLYYLLQKLCRSSLSLKLIAYKTQYDLAGNKYWAKRSILHLLVYILTPINIRIYIYVYKTHLWDGPNIKNETKKNILVTSNWQRTRYRPNFISQKLKSKSYFLSTQEKSEFNLRLYFRPPKRWKHMKI